MVHQERSQLVKHLIVAEVPSDLTRQTFPGIFLHPDEQAQRPPVGGAERDKVLRPDMVTGGRPSSNTGASSQPEAPAFGVLLRDLQPLLPPEAFHTLMVHAPASRTQPRGDPAMAIPPILGSELDNLLGQGRCIITHLRPIPLSRARMPQDATEAAFRHRPLLAELRHTSASAAGA